ncbi:hypothetical protein AB6D07_04675, partial [Vibrio sp. 10N.239.312.C11]|uniref:hypothetical protein n=1 Tax=Vibrio sp. 10N.239.312.C11 TaxID=3229977 RepID=UPI00354EBCF7
EAKIFYLWPTIIWFLPYLTSSMLWLKRILRWFINACFIQCGQHYARLLMSGITLSVNLEH